MTGSEKDDHSLALPRVGWDREDRLRLSVSSKYGFENPTTSLAQYKQ